MPNVLAVILGVLLVSQVDVRAAAVGGRDECDERVAIESLFNLPAERWDDGDVAKAAAECLRAQTTPHDQKLAIAWAAVNANRFPVVRSHVEWLLESAAGDDNIRRYAAVLATGIDDQYGQQPSADLLTLFRTSAGFVRAEAAIVIAAHSRATLPAPLRKEVILEIISQMTDHRVSSVDRGRAIKASQFFAADDAELTDALLTLSRRERWFHGVQGAHYLQPSVVEIIHALGQRQDVPAVKRRLKTIGRDISEHLTGSDQWLANVALEFVHRRPAG